MPYVEVAAGAWRGAIVVVVPRNNDGLGGQSRIGARLQARNVVGHTGTARLVFDVKRHLASGQSNGVIRQIMVYGRLQRLRRGAGGSQQLRRYRIAHGDHRNLQFVVEYDLRGEWNRPAQPAADTIHPLEI